MSPLYPTRTIPSASTAALIAALSFSLALQPSGTLAADEAVYAKGQPIVTGFSGVVEPEAPPDGSDPLDYTFIDLDGASMVIQGLEPDDKPSGQLIPSTTVFSATAKDVGQVFSIALDSAPELTGAAAPNIYLAATSAFGLNLVVPDADGNLIRSKIGAADATFMPGQWGGAGGDTGYPGSIWKVDGETGEISLFSTVTNSGAGLGDIVYDVASAQFFVSDLDTGLIYRLGEDGTIVDTFDHGVTARPEHELDPVEDDGAVADITDPTFSTEDPATWGFTQPERRVTALATNGGRLYYASGSQIWSVRIQSDGSFGTARWELDIVDLPSTNEVTDMLFDPQGRITIAQRGTQAGSYDYSAFAEPQTSSVVRYKREFPKNETTPSTWVEEPDTYVIGFAEGGTSASGGIALGPKYNDDTGAFDGACNAYLWSTGDSLRNNPDLDPALDPPAQVHGLQGNSRNLVWPQNNPPLLSFFVDYDGNTDDDQETAQGHVGSVAVWQECTSDAATYVEPSFIPDEDYDDEEYDDEDDEDEVNLTLEKWSKPYWCFDAGANWHCLFTIRIENTGDEPYWGPVAVYDHLPDHNPGAVMDFWPQPPWSCSPAGASAYECVTGPVLLYPGDGIVLHEVVDLPKAAVDYCELVNVAGLDWFWDSDDDPSDDSNIGIAGIKAPGCAPPGVGSDLILKKAALPPVCLDAIADWACTYMVIVQNVGPQHYSGPITVTDTLGIDAPATIFGPWSCAQVGPELTCHILAAPVNVPPGWFSGFFVTAHVPKGVAPVLCDLDNEANIAVPAAGAVNNMSGANDSDSASTHIPEPGCAVAKPKTDLEVQKSALGCVGLVYLGVPGYMCDWQAIITNVGPDDYLGPITFEDTSEGATFNELLPIPPICGGPSTDVTCTAPAPVHLLSGVPHAFNFHTFYPDAADACSATNNMSIVVPNSGSDENPAGNDSASASLPLPNPACAGLPKVNVQKTAAGCGPDPSSTDWLCDFDVTITNLGAAPQVGPIDVYDFNSKPTTFSTPACAPAGPGAYKCTAPGPLNPGDTWTFQATTHVDPAGVTIDDCNVDNWVWITNPLDGDPGHLAHSNQKVPQLFINVGPGPVAVYCDPPSLSLAKVSEKTVKKGNGYNVTYRVTATSMGPDDYHGTVELDEVLPDGTTFVDSSWTCVPTIGNDMHCSSPYKDIPVTKYTTMTITIHIPTDAAVAAQCNVVNTVNAAISAEVLHSDVGAQYSASAAAKLPASICRAPQACSPDNRIKPDRGCCDEGLVWNGKQCAEPRPNCPDDSHLTGGKCVCDQATHGKPGSCEPDQSKPICDDDSRIVGGECRCLPGTHGKPGKCKPDEVELVCADDSHESKGKCVCDRGTHGKPGECEPDKVELTCADDSHESKGKCICDRGTHGKPGECEPDKVELTCPSDSHESKGKCVCDRGTSGSPGQCVADKPQCPKDSRFDDGACRCLPGTEGRPGRCTPIETKPLCPDDSHFEKRRKSCVCDRGTIGEPGSCTLPQVELNNSTPRLQTRRLNLPSTN